MRLAAIWAILVAAAIMWVSMPSTAQAKIFIEISPSSGPPGTVVHVHGLGFQTGQDARIELRPSTSAIVSFETVDSAADLSASMHLATISPNANYEIDGTATIPTAAELADAFGGAGPAFEIIAIGTNDQIDGVFVAAANFTLTGASLPAAGAGSAADDEASLPVGLLLASLGVAAASFGIILWRRRAHGGGAAHADTTRRGPEGP